MTAYPISAVSRLTGLSVDTLRAWERRYRAVVPQRSPRGRIYSESQIKRLLLLRQAVERGHAIGQVAGVRDRALRELLDRSSSLARITPRHVPVAAPENDAQNFLNPVLRAIVRYDFAQADQELKRLAAAMASARDLIHQVALPLMRTMGERWHRGECSIAQEHFVSSLLTALLSSFIRTYIPSNPPARVLFATPREERHGFPNLAAALLTAAGGLGVIPLGTDLPKEDILLAARRSEANALLLSVSKAPDAEIRQDILFIAAKAPKAALLWLGGPADLSLLFNTNGSRWQLLHDFTALERELKTLGARF